MVKQKFASASQQCLPLAAVSATYHAANSLRWRLRLPFCVASAFCLLASSCCAAASCCPPAHSPPPLAVPPPLVTTLPRVVPLSFCWLSHFPAPQPLSLAAPPPGALASAICYASTFCHAPLVWLVAALPSASTPISLQLRLVPRPPPLVDPSLVTAFGIVCRHSCCRIRPVQHHFSQSRRPPNITISVVVAVRVRCQRGASFAVAVAAGALARVRCQRGVSPAVAHRARHQGVAPTREQVRVNDVCVPETPLESWAKKPVVLASCRGSTEDYVFQSRVK